MPDSTPPKNVAAAPYPQAENDPDFPRIEEAVQAYWAEHGIFEKSVDQRAGAAEFVFYDGPPFANGLPHYGHLVTGYVKDIVPRYQTMRGHQVHRRFGWDCHGLPAEMAAEKELGVSGRKAITDYGIDKFNAAARDLVMKYTDEWEFYVNRAARWVDFENDYKTMDITFMESVLWAFKTLWDRGLIYEDYRVVPYSWAVESPLSNFETRLDNAYRERQDPAVTVAFPLIDAKGPLEGAALLIWTTTPWTLPSNLAVGVGPEIDYSVIDIGDARYVIAEGNLPRYEKEFAEAETIAVVKGRDLKGLHYQPPFDYFAGAENAFQVLTADFVELGEGTGLVHLAPGFGEDDLTTCRDAGIPMVVPVDEKGRFTDEVSDYAGELVFDANKPITRSLRDRGLLIRHETYLHNYPHCWRTDQPLIYKAVNSWYLKVSEFRERMVALNQEINWIPGHVKDGIFGNWLANARDWNISRKRFWGTPLPIWKSDDPDYPRVDVYGSLDEIERDFGVRPDDLHRPFIDNLTRPNPDDPTGKSTMRRIDDVLDGWFESGSMPFAQVHYPFENKDWFDSHFPGDFIVEYIAQTRGWFYTLMVLGVLLFDKAPFRNCMCHGVVLDENKQKLSKRLQNYPDPVHVFDSQGADAMRWYLVDSPVLAGGDLAIKQDGSEIAEVQREVLRPIWNAYYFFTLYANIDGYRAKIIDKADGLLDRYLLAKTRELIETAQAHLDAYELAKACDAITAFVGAMNNWYIRRNRARFWRAGEDADKQAAFDTLYTALTMLCRVAAPLLPMLSERIYRALTGEDSVHLTDWPDAAALPAEPALVEAMDSVREICSAILAVREKNQRRVRLPLAKAVIIGQDLGRFEPYADIIADEVNIKQIAFDADAEKWGSLQLKVNPKIGKRLGKKMKEVMAAAKTGGWQRNPDGTVSVAEETLSLEEYSLRLDTADGLEAEPLFRAGMAVVVDITTTPELEAEGLARDLIRLIQNARKDADFAVTDRISLNLTAPDTVIGQLTAHLDLIKAETLTTDLSFGDASGAEFSADEKLGGESIKLTLARV